MSGDNQKKSDKSTEPKQDNIQELPEQSITDRDAQTVKGGMLPNAKKKWY